MNVIDHKLFFCLGAYVCVRVCVRVCERVYVSVCERVSELDDVAPREGKA